MVKCEYHNLETVKKIILPILESDFKRFSTALSQIKKMSSQPKAYPNRFEISQHHMGFASIPISSDLLSRSKKSNNSDFFRLSKIYVLNQDGHLKELNIFFSANLISGIAIKENLENIDLKSLDFSEMQQDQPQRTKYFIEDIDLEGMFDDFPDILDFIDAEYISEQYNIDGQTLYRIIAFDDYRCICVCPKMQVFKVNLKITNVEKLFHDFKEFEITLNKNNNYVFELFGEN